MKGFKAQQHLIGSKLCEMLEEIFEKHHKVRYFNEILIVFISKVENATSRGKGIQTIQLV